MLTQEYDEAATMELFREEGHRKGLEEGLERGHKEGLEEGLERGHKKGLEEGFIRSLIGLVHDGLLTVDAAAARAPIPSADFYAMIQQSS